MIREPYNINPYNSTIDTSKVNNFGFTFSGDELGSWKVEIAKNNTSPDIVYTSKEFVPSDVGYEHIYDSDRVEGITLPSTIAHNQEDDGLLRRLYDIVGYPYNASVVRLAVNDINDLGKIKGCTSDGYLVATTYSLGREDENVTILGYDENGVAVGTQVTNGTYNFLGYLLTVKANTDIQSGQKVQIEGNTFTIGDIEDTQDGYYELMITNGTGSFSGDAAVVTFDTLALADLTELKVKLTPVQDLNGYDAPWPSGGGKNKIDDTIKTVNGNSLLIGATTTAEYPFHLKVGTYRLTVFRTTSASKIYGYLKTSTSDNIIAINNQSGSTPSGTVNITTEGDYRVWIYGGSGSTVDGSITHVSLTEGSDAVTEYIPYSNICPIYPSNGKNLVNIGGSVFDTQQNPTTALPLASYSLIKGFAYTGYVRPNNITSFSASGTTITLTTTTSDYGVGLIAEVEVGKTYTFSATHDGYVVFAYYDASGFFVLNENKGTQGSYSTTVPSGAKYLIVLIRGATAGTSNISIDKPQLEQGSTATPYVPYQGINVYHSGEDTTDYTTYPLSLGRDVYGGTLDVVSGKLVVDKVCVDLGTLTWSYNSTNTVFSAPAEGGITNLGLNVMPDIICSNYPIIRTRYGSNFPSAPDKSCTWSRDTSNVLVKDTDYTDKTTFKTAMNGVQLVYPLAIPIEYNLTPTQISTLLGENNVWSNGNILNVTFSYEES